MSRPRRVQPPEPSSDGFDEHLPTGEFVEAVEVNGRRYEVSSTSTGFPPGHTGQSLNSTGAWWRVDDGSWQPGERSWVRTMELIRRGEIGR